MSKNYGQMMSYADAIAWIEDHTPDIDGKGRVLARMNFEMDKGIPLKPVLHKGKHSRVFDSYTCRNCGRELDVGYDYCPLCGTAIKWDSPRCLTGYHEEGEES